MGCLCPTDALQYIRHSKASDAPRDAVPSEGAPDAEQNKGGRRRARRPSLAALAEINAGGNIATVARAGAVSPTISGITRQMAGSDAAVPGNKGRTRGGGRAPRGTATSEGGGGGEDEGRGGRARRPGLAREKGGESVAYDPDAARRECVPCRAKIFRG